MRLLSAMFVVAALLAPSRAPAGPKTVRVEHGRPVVVVSEKSVLVLEFVKEPIKDALVPHDDPSWRHCRARYRFQLFNGETGTITNGQGLVEEIYRVVLTTPTGQQIEDKGSRTGIGAGPFGFSWSQASAGARSWLYYQSSSPVRFLQQPEHLKYDEFTPEQFQRYLASRNVQQFISAGTTVHVIGPAVFSGDLPTETPTAARVDSARVVDGAFELKLSQLSTNKHYVIDSSYELKSASWNAVHTFIARESDHKWSERLGKDVDVIFYRIRESAY